MMSFKIDSLFCIALSFLCLSACSSMDTSKHEIPLVKQDITINALPICYDHGCAVISHIQLSQNTWNNIQSLFSVKQLAFEERLAVRQAISLLEKEASLHTPVGIDLPKNTNDIETGRQDCLDESTNTTHFLTLLENNNLLQWHTVGSRVYRAHFLIDQHYAAQIIHKHTEQRYVVDSWYLANGELPYIQPYEQWALKKTFSLIDNPS
ncbi:MAG: hypothetical protein ACRBCI_03970 [Cellvibrionaceae bacterium]